MGKVLTGTEEERKVIGKGRENNMCLCGKKDERKQETWKMMTKKHSGEKKTVDLPRDNDNKALSESWKGIWWALSRN